MSNVENDILLEAIVVKAKALLGDTESMQERPESYREEFGPFSDYRENEDHYGAVIQWPNLAISADDLKTSLAALEAANG